MVFLSKSLARDRVSPLQPFIEGGWSLLAVMLGWTLINKILFIEKKRMKVVVDIKPYEMTMLYVSR